MSTGSGEATDLATARGRDYPSVRQFSIFSPNKVGQLLALVRMIETAQIRVCALSVTESADCAIIRLVVNHPERAFEILKQGGYEFCEVDLLVVELPQRPQPMLHICSTLIQAELNIHFCFPLLVRPHGQPAMAFYVDDHETAAAALQAAGYVVLTEADLQ
jgi:hypothetical protein